MFGVLMQWLEAAIDQKPLLRQTMQFQNRCTVESLVNCNAFG
jgi:hypothetical protein